MQLEHRIVHLDLKGAPWKIPYLEKVLLKAKAWGATGVLFEWEDTFPYTDELVMLGSVMDSGGDGMYTMEEVQHILRFCSENCLEAIQLVQTMGHLEFVLKHAALGALREARSPSALCPARARARALVRDLLRQVLDAQPAARFLHIGADEVWHIGICPDCKKQAEASEHGVASLYLEHIRDLVIFIKELRSNLTILMWDDMMRSMNFDTLQSYKLGALVQPVVWDYGAAPLAGLRARTRAAYAALFPRLWAASAFKGANGDTTAISPVSRYVSNHVAWMDEIERYPDLKFVGIILTGWSRYNHFTTLCELLPVSLPSLASCLKTVTIVDDRPLESLISEDLPSADWPGENLARCVRHVVSLTQKCHEFVAEQTNVARNLEGKSTETTNMSDKPSELLKELLAVREDVTNLLSEITGKRSTEEWVQFNVMPAIKMLTELTNSTDVCLPSGNLVD